jgi:hypothetical protein
MEAYPYSGIGYCGRLLSALHLELSLLSKLVDWKKEGGKRQLLWANESPINRSYDPDASLRREREMQKDEASFQKFRRDEPLH